MILGRSMAEILKCHLLSFPEFIEWPLPSQVACFHPGTTVVPR